MTAGDYKFVQPSYRGPHRIPVSAVIESESGSSIKVNPDKDPDLIVIKMYFTYP